MKTILLAAVVLQMIGCAEKKNAEGSNAQTNTVSFSTEGKTVFAYTTADSTNYRLSATDTATFTEFGQPFETQVCVFVDPSKTDQTFMGIGAAVTDASAETLAKLPADKQAELLSAYFDKENGIGYTIVRTNINSCDFSSDMYTYVADGDRIKIIQH